jgi:hypothetical protein
MFTAMSSRILSRDPSFRSRPFSPIFGFLHIRETPPLRAPTLEMD